MNTNNRMVKFKNTLSGKVIVHEPAYNIHREFPEKGAVQFIPFDIVEQLLWRQGFKNMVQTGILYIEDMQDKIDLQLEDPDTKVPTRIKILTEEQILTLLKVRSFEDFKKELATVSMDQANAVVDYAVANFLVDNQKVNYLKELTGRDVVAIIANKRAMEEADRAAAEKERRRKNEGEFNPV